MLDPARVLLVDLNNFARYPTLPIGYLAAILRRAKCEVSVFSPLMLGVRGVTREPRLHPLSLPLAKINYRLATATTPSIRRARDWIAARRRSDIDAKSKSVVRAFEKELRRMRPDVVLISTYLMYKEICTAICALCERERVPVLVGGPYFAQKDVVN